MIKVKSISKEPKEIGQGRRNFIKVHGVHKEMRMLRTADYRNRSHEYVPLTHSTQKCNSIKCRELSTSKYQRKESKLPEINLHSHKNIHHEQKDSKKHIFSQTFIGSKLKKKLQKYLLLLSLVNYSLRISYQRSELKKYKVFIGKGNNSKLIKTIFRSRFWWTITEDENQANLIWTQKSKKKIFGNIQDAQKEKIKIQEESNPIIIHKKIKVKKKDKKNIFFDEDIEGILTDKDKILLKNQCRKQNLSEDIRAYIKKLRLQKRKNINITHNHLQNHRILTNKKSLYYSLKNYCDERNCNVFNYVPLTFHVTGQEGDLKELLQIQEKVESKRQKQKLLWIIKPGQNSNRGCGIQICKKVEHIKRYLEREKQKHSQRTFIIQKYINPFLFHRRKFDIRCFALVTASPMITAYFYPVGYIRTSCYEFSTKNYTNKYIHLTNDAVQKKANEYSKYQMGNKVRFEEFQKYLDLFHADKNISFGNEILPMLKELVALSIRSSKNFQESSKEHTFEILGYDFMLDEDLQPWLIQINTNPCLQTDGEILNDIVPTMVENAVKIALDPVFRPPKIQEWGLNQLLTCSQRILERNKFQLVYSQLHELL